MKTKVSKTVTASNDNQIDHALAKNNKEIFQYFDEKFKELKESLGYKEKLKEWNRDLFRFSMSHQV